jgi:hypothetical protein
MIGIVIGVAPAARIDGDHMPLRRAGGERRCELVEISGAARQSRQTHHRHAG